MEKKLQDDAKKVLTQDALAHMLGISGKAVSKWERSLSEPSEGHMKSLVEFLDLEAENVEKNRCRNGQEQGNRESEGPRISV